MTDKRKQESKMLETAAKLGTPGNCPPRGKTPSPHKQKGKKPK